jgi:ligand-binding sensor domain-containing protein/signal transduction histidine kinase
MTLLTALGLLVALAPAASRQIRFHQITQEQGLSHSYVRAIVQDRRGFVWFGTPDGLDRFDGYTIRTFRHDPAEPTSLPENSVTSLAVDHDGTLWIGTYGGGLARYEHETESFVPLRHQEDRPGSLPHDNVEALLVDSRGDLWVGMDTGGLARLDRSTRTFVNYRNDPDDPSTLGYDDVWDIAEDGDGNLWLATFGGGLAFFDRQRGVFRHHLHDPADPASLAHDEVVALDVDSRGDVWAGTYGGGLDRYDPASGAFRHYRHDGADPSSLGGDVVLSLLEDRRGRFWVGTETGGLDLMDREAGTFQRHTHDPYSPSSIGHDSVESIHEDVSGVIWVGTYNGGVSFFHETRFEHFGQRPGSAGLPSSVVTSLVEDRHGDVWIGTDGGGLARFDRQSGTFRHYRHDPGDPESLSNDAVLALLEDRHGDLWIGTYAGGLNRFDRATETFRRYRHDPGDPTSLGRNDVRCLLEDSRGRLWIGTALAGLDLMDREAGTFEAYGHDDPASLGDDDVYAILEDRRGRLWLGSPDSGLERLDPDTGASTRFRHRADDPSSLASDRIFSLFEDSGGRLWVGTGLGLDLFEPARETFTHHTVRDGLPNDVVNAILEDDQGHLWLSTNRGLSRFDPDAGTFRNYDVLDGLQASQFTPRAAMRSRAGELYFGGVDGFNVFRPDALRDNPYVPPVVLTELFLDNRPVAIDPEGPLTTSITETESLVLSHGHSVVAIGYAALSYVAAAKNEHAYRMEGFDQEWQYVGPRRSATYTNLDPGRYVFHVKAANGDGLWNETGTSLAITVTPPYWQTWWFRIAAGCLVALLAVSAYRLRVRSIEGRNAELRRHNLELNREIGERRRAEEALRETERQVRKLNEELEERVRKRTAQLEATNEELEAFAYSVSHDLRAPLRHVAGFGEILIEDYETAIDERGRDYLRRLLGAARHMGDLIDGLLRLSRVTRGEMRYERVDLSATARRIAADLDPARRAQVDIAPDLEVWGDSRFLEVALENLLANAFKFSSRAEEPRIELGVLEPSSGDGPGAAASGRVFFVRDNGAGFDMAYADALFGAFQRLHDAEEFEGSGIGLATVQRIVHRHGGRIWAEGAVGQGATFYFTLT